MKKDKDVITGYNFGGYADFFTVYRKQLEEEQNNKVSDYSPDSLKLSYQHSSERVIKLNNGAEARLAILTPTKTSPPTTSDIHIASYIASVSVIKRLISQKFSDADVIAVDIETKGVAAHDIENKIVGIGVASHSSIVYFDIETNTKEVNQYLYEWLASPELKLVGHNILFDGCFLLRETGKWLNWQYDTYGLYKQLANEGFKNQSWGLKNAQVQLLGWEEKGDIELDYWLIRNRYITSSYKKDSSTEELIEQYTAGLIKVDKSQMWKAPADILGYYCGLDCAATYQLLAEVILPSISGQVWEDVFLSYHEMFINNVKLLAEQQLSGITVNKKEVEQHFHNLKGMIEDAVNTFTSHPDINKHLVLFDKIVVSKLKEKEPVKHKKLPKLSAPPPQFKKDGSPSVAYKKWLERKKMIQNFDLNSPEFISKNWLKWKEKYDEALEMSHFNTNSSHHLSWLFYDRLKCPVIIRTDNGEPSTGSRALPGFGEYGKLLKNIKDLVKEEGYVQGCIEHLYEDAEGNFRIHPQFRAPGTLTCRLAGSGGINIQQLPKSRGYLNCWKPRKGYAWVDCDHSALEQVVLAELSCDRSLWKIYGPGAKSNDIYLFNGSQLPGIGDTIRRAGYDPDNPDSEIIKHVKKQCKKERTIAKVITLGSSYGMGASKLQLTLKLQGVDVSLDEAKEMHSSYWKLYSGVKEYEKFLLEEWKINNGWVLNGIGRPVCCSDEYIKDIVNRVVQSTGHDIHMWYVDIIDYLFKANGLEVNGIVWDFHDQSIVECRERDAELVRRLMEEDAYDILNNQILKGQIPMKGEAVIIKTLAEAKCE